MKLPFFGRNWVRAIDGKKDKIEEADDNGEIQCLFWIDRFWVGSFCISSGCRKEFLDFWDIFICMMHNGHCTPIWIEDRIFNIIFERITVNFAIRFIHITRLD
ncbi:hypothetical protein RIR_jg32240.t1 [Rhizophagus irregularis DAOM 181602=DAOM 197198]|nr:hypothetical protein RIR_jg32240.t1 [Rhizophagus irregularis DAOM 181602=DAOM 197198]